MFRKCLDTSWHLSPDKNGKTVGKTQTKTEKYQTREDTKKSATWRRQKLSPNKNRVQIKHRKLLTNSKQENYQIRRKHKKSSQSKTTRFTAKWELWGYCPEDEKTPWCKEKDERKERMKEARRRVRNSQVARWLKRGKPTRNRFTKSNRLFQERRRVC